MGTASNKAKQKKKSTQEEKETSTKQNTKTEKLPDKKSTTKITKKNEPIKKETKNQTNNKIKTEHFITEPTNNKLSLAMETQLQNCFCKIYKDKGNISIGCGFLCNLPFPDILHTLSVLATNTNIINQEDVRNSKNIFLSFSDKNKKISISLDQSRKTFFNKYFNITFIEILPKKDKINNFMDIDYYILTGNLNNRYKNKQIYIFQYPPIENSESNISEISNNSEIIQGKIEKIIKHTISHTCKIFNANFSGPILSLDTYKIIGIQNSEKNKEGFYEGTCIKFPIETFIEENKYKEDINEIIITLEIKNDNELNKECYFLDNMNDFVDEKGLKHKHDNLKELNENNTKLFINDKEYRYQKFFKFKLKGIYTIKLQISTELTDCSYMFYDCKNITNINLISFDTKNVTNMCKMFYNCINLISIKLGSNFDTFNVNNMNCMFYGCNKLQEIDLSGFETGNVKDMSGMFYDCKTLTNLNLSVFNTQNVLDMNYMFFNCYNLEELNLDGVKTEKVKEMKNIFSFCRKIKSLNLGFFDVSKDTNMEGIFAGCKALKEIAVNKVSYEIFTKIKNDNNFGFTILVKQK